MFGFLTLFAPRSPSPHRKKNCEVAPKASESIFGVVGFFREINNLHTMPGLKSGGRFVFFRSLFPMIELILLYGCFSISRPFAVIEVGYEYVACALCAHREKESREVERGGIWHNKGQRQTRLPSQ